MLSIYTMKIMVFKIVALVSSLTLYGQKTKNYVDYHHKMLRIEECTARENFDSSITMYFDLFNEYERVFSKDAYNACQIAALIKHKHFSYFFTKCAETGIKKQFLFENELIHSSYLNDTISLNKSYIIGINKFNTKIDTALRRDFFRRYETEQKIKGKDGYAEICEDNFNRILDLAKQGKFPGEDLIGNTDLMESMVIPTFCHYPYSYKFIEPYLEEALNRGQITPISIVYFYGFNQARTSKLYNEKIPIDTVNYRICYNMPFGKQSYDFKEVNRQRLIHLIFSMATQNNLRNLRTKHKLDYQLGY